MDARDPGTGIFRVHARNLFFLLAIGSIVLGASSCSSAPTDTEPIFDLHRLSDRVLVLTERSPMENNIIALASESGLVVVDTSGSPVTAERARRTIQREFGRSDFRWVVNTHHHWDHSWGNQVFRRADIVAHASCVKEMGKAAGSVRERASRLRRNLEELERDLPGEPDETQRRSLAFTRRNYEGIREGFAPTPPTKTFDDRLELDLGDLTLKLFYFGRAHSGSDILILVPEEGLLMTGDLFLEKTWLPLFSGMRELDIDRWIEILGETLDGEHAVRHVVPGHIDIWEREKLARWRDYIVELWDGVREVDEADLPLEEAFRRIPLGEQFDYLLERGHSRQQMSTFHERNVRSFWMQLKESAAAVIEKTMTEQGLKAALARYERLRSGNDGGYYFDEQSFNSLGYKLLSDNRITEALAVFRLNVEAYPGSWNVYDSLAEGYMAQGDIDRAVRNYNRSLELNPRNDNAIMMLERLGFQEPAGAHLVE